MNSSERVKVLMFIWIAFAVAAGWSFSGDATNFNDVILGLTFAIAAVMGTRLVLRYGGEDSTAMIRKSKRGDNDLYHAIDAMDDEELRALRRRLMVDNEASVSMQDLLSREQKQQQSQ